MSDFPSTNDGLPKTGIVLAFISGWISKVLSALEVTVNTSNSSSSEPLFFFESGLDRRSLLSSCDFKLQPS